MQPKGPYQVKTDGDSVSAVHGSPMLRYTLHFFTCTIPTLQQVAAPGWHPTEGHVPAAGRHLGALEAFGNAL